MLEVSFKPMNQGHVRVTCVFYCICDIFSPLSGKVQLLLQTQKALTLRHISSAIIPLDQLFVRRHLRCRNGRPLNVLFSTDRATGSALLKVTPEHKERITERVDYGRPASQKCTLFYETPKSRNIAQAVTFCFLSTEPLIQSWLNLYGTWDLRRGSGAGVSQRVFSFLLLSNISCALIYYRTESSALWPWTI
jgi:hypothetical protein